MKPLAKGITIGEKYEPAMKITDQAVADAYFELLVAHTMSYDKSRSEAEAIERQNLGYYAGYYSDATRQRVEQLFGCSHPIFGKIAAVGAPTTEEALQDGLERGRSAR